jgi:RHS repeat-associated protein
MTAAGKTCVDKLSGFSEVVGLLVDRRRRGHEAARSWGVSALVATLVASLLVPVPLPAAAAPVAPVGPSRPQQWPSARLAPAKPVPIAHPRNDAVRTWRPRPVSWPKAGTAEADLSTVPAGGSDAVTRTGRAVTAGTPTAAVPVGALPVRLRQMSADGPARVAVTLADRQAALRAGVNGLLLTVRAADARSATTSTRPTLDGRGPARRVEMAVDYTAFADAYGGDWAGRLRLVTLPGCVLTTPDVPACQTQTVVAGGANNAARRTLTAQVDLPAAPAGAAGDREPAPAVVLAATAGPAGGGGDYTATPLKPSGSWTAGSGVQDFTYSYPVTVPPVPGGLVPGVTLSYDSQSVDGEQVATNNQPSWIGDGWSYSPGYVERSYVSCKDDPIGGGPATSDSCWAGQVVHLSFGSVSGDLVYDPAAPTRWRVSNDDGTRVEQLPGAPGGNGTWDGDYWKLTTRDGTQYFFGLNHLPGATNTSPATNSAWTQPVYHTPDNCGAPSCVEAWRWNLDYVVNTHHEALAYFYGTETNLYGADNAAIGVPYVRGGWLDHVDYGLRDPIPYASQAPARIQFTTDERCVASAAACAPGNIATHPTDFPDVPYDLNCDLGRPCNTHTPTFWSRRRLTAITTQITNGAGGWTPVDTYRLTHTLPDPQDGTAKPALWLASIQHTGGTGPGAVTLPAVSFAATNLANRADGVDGAPAMNHNRISTITTETGEVIGVQYRTECTAPVHLDPAHNSSLCYPVYWTPDGAATPTRDWFHKYVVTEIDDQDTTGLSGSTGPRTTTVATAYTPLDAPAWHFDDNELVKPKYRTYGQWRGYGQIQTRTGGALDPKTLTETRYYRGMDGDVLPDGGRRAASVTLSGAVPVPNAAASLPDANELAGSVREQISYNGDGGPADHATVTDYWVSPPTASRARTGLPALTATMLHTVATRTTTAIRATSPTTWRTTRTDTSYDTATGLPTVVFDHGDIAQPDQARCTTTAYAPANIAANIVGLPAEVETDAGPCAGSGVNGLSAPTGLSRPADVISDVRTFYDDDPAFATDWPQAAPSVGDASMALQARDYTGGTFVYLTKTRASYDNHGRPTQVRDANNNLTTTTYTDVNGLTTTSTVTNPLGQSVTTTVDPARGQPVTTQDPNHLLTDVRYDALGRIIGVWRPGRSRASGGNLQFAYQISQTAPSTVTTQTLLENDAYKTSIAFFDALDRPRQTQTDTPIGGRVVTDTFYDTRGWAYKKNNAYYQDGAPSTVMLDAVGQDNRIPNQDLTTFDGLGRPAVVVSNMLGNAQWQTQIVYGGDRTTTIPPTGGTPTTTIADGLGRTVEIDHDTTPPTVTGNSQVTGGDPVKTTYGYDRRGNQATVTDDQNHTWTSTFDLLGRTIAKNDPDTGTSTLSYDDVGNLLTTTDARGNTISYGYDPLSRRTGSYDGPTTSAPKLASWTYDTAPNGIGNLAAATSYDNRDATSYPYTTAVSGYNQLGQPLGTSVTIPADPRNGALARTYTTTFEYTPTTSLLQDTVYDDAATLPAEMVVRGYNRLGDPISVGGNRVNPLAPLATYVSTSTYTPYGQFATNKLGVGTAATSAFTNYHYDQHTLRLRAASIAHAGAPNIDNASYLDNPAGQITSTTDTRNNTTSETQCYDYDLLGRLTTAWTATDQCHTDVATTGANTTVGGINPYWTSWTYNHLGDRTSQTDHAIPGAAGDTTSTYNYPTTAQPNTLQAISTNGPAGTSTSSYSYDPTGNTTARTTPDHGSQTFAWNTQNQLATVTTATPNGPTTNADYTYDPDGRLLLQRNPATATATLYLPDEELTLNTTTGAVSGNRYYTLGAITAIRNGPNKTDYNFLVTDPHGTAALTLDHNTQNPTWRSFTPYGAPRGPQPPTWPDTHAYLGLPTDPTTGLNLLGARNYDPTVGRFISPDPVFQPTDPNQIGGYTYAGDDPVNKADPTGLDPCPHGGGGCANDGTDPATTQGPPPADCSGPFCYPAPAPACGNDTACGHRGGGVTCSAKCKLQQNALGATPPPLGFLRGNGYKGSDNFTLGEALDWARTSKVAAMYVCQHVLDGGMSDAACGDPAKDAGKNQAPAIVMLILFFLAPYLLAARGGAADDAAGEALGADVMGDAEGTTQLNRVKEFEDSLADACSFDPDTPVLLADHTSKPIKDIHTAADPGPGPRPGASDTVESTDPTTHTTNGEPVTHLHRNTDTQLADLTVIDPAGHRATIHTTSNHPFWDATTQRRTPTAELRPSDLLLTTPGHDGVHVVSVHTFAGHQQMLNLTIANIHTYYVVAGTTPILVHNTCVAEDAFRIEQHVNPRHTPGGALNAGKSTFNQGEDLLALAQRTTTQIGRRQAGTGRIEYVIDAGRVIGQDANGIDTNVYTVIRTGGREVYNGDFLEYGDLVTMHPGTP